MYRGSKLQIYVLYGVQNHDSNHTNCMKINNGVTAKAFLSRDNRIAQGIPPFEISFVFLWAIFAQRLKVPLKESGWSIATGRVLTFWLCESFNDCTFSQKGTWMYFSTFCSEVSAVYRSQFFPLRLILTAFKIQASLSVVNFVSLQYIQVT